MRWLLCSGLLFASGCYSANVSAPHQPYAPLLDHAGQLDVVARGGVMENNGTTLALQAAYAPVDHFSIAVSVDADVDRSDDERARHFGGGLAFGTFTRTEILRLEAMAGVGFGHAEGQALDCVVPDGSPCIDYTLDGPYIQPFLQSLVGFEVPYFELAGGMRVFAQATTVAFVASDGSSGQGDGFERVFIEPILTLRVPVDVVRFEVLAGLPIALGGDSGPLPGSAEPLTYFYITFGLGLQLDTMEPPLDVQR
jgi:hypothetical protein